VQPKDVPGLNPLLHRIIPTGLAAAVVAAGLLLPAAPAAGVATPLVAARATAALEDPGPQGLRVNGLEEPADLGDLTDPDYSWQVPTGMQTAYRIVVATSPARAQADEGDVWDSGRVESAQQLNVVHGGPDLQAGERYYWKVRTWDDEQGSPWSAVTSFGTAPGATWAGSTPIWADAQVPGEASAPWRDYTVTARIRITAGALGLRFRAFDSGNSFMWQFRASDNRLTPHVQVNGTYATLGSSVALPAGTLVANTWTPVRIVVAGTTVTTFINDVQVDQRSDPRHVHGTVGVRTGNSEAGQVDDLQVVETGTGRVLVENAFEGANPFPCGSVSGGVLTVGNGQNCALVNPANVPANWAFLRTEVDLADKEIAWATLNATGTEFRNHLQYVYKTYVNGEFVGLGPTNRIGTEARYDGYDVTALLRRGEANAIGALAYTTNANRRFQAQLKVVYADGTSEVFGTGTGWRSLNGGLVFPEAGSIGTSYFSAPMENLDARQFPFGFAEPGFDDSAWLPAVARPVIPQLEPTPTGKVEQQLHEPVRIIDKGDGNYFVDFGRTWVGGVQYDVANGTAGSRVELRFGEVTSGADTVRWELNTTNKYRDIVTLKEGEQRLETWGMRVFRYVEIVGATEPVTQQNLKALALVYPFDRDASSFTSSDQNLNQVYQLSKNSIESLNVNFYTDSWTRERTNYEADGYLQQLSSLYLMDDLSLGRYSTNYFKSNRTWPTEWPIFVVLSVYDAWRQTGNTEQVADYYDNLKAKLRPDWLEAATGLVRKTTGSNGSSSCNDCDIVDWPTSQRDGYQFRQYNTVLNTLFYRATRDMAAMAEILGKDADAATYTAQADRLREQINARLYDAEGGRYDDGMDASGVRTGHYSVHASAFALAFGVPEDDQLARVADYVDSRGMACSVYCAAFLVKGLYDGGNGQAALDALTDEGTSSWMNMIRLGAGSTMEAWDPSQKSNLTYSHPWAASPAFNVPSGLFGIQPLSDAYGEFQVKPQPGDLQRAAITVPTVRGPISAAFDHDTRGRTELSVTVPGNTTATVQVPLAGTVRPEYVPSHPEAAEYVGRSQLPGGTYATFRVGPGDWTFGPKAADDLGAFQDVLDELLNLGDLVDAHRTTGDLEADEATAVDARLDPVEALVRSASAAHAAADGATARAGLGDALDGLRDLAGSLGDLVADATVVADLTPRIAHLETLMIGLAYEIRGLTVTLAPVEGAVTRGQQVAGTVRLTNAGDAAVGPFTADFSVGDWTVESTDTTPAALAAGASQDLAFTTRVPDGQGSGPVRASVSVSFTDDGTTYPAVVEREWATVDSQVSLVDASATHPVDFSNEVAEVVATVRNAGSVAATGRLQAELPAGWRQAAPAVRTVAPGGEITQRLRVFVPVGYVGGDVRDLPVSFVGEQTLASATVPLALQLGVPEPAVLIDHVDFGETVSEAAHGIQAAPSSGISTEAGFTRRYAHSNFPGSWFSAEVNAIPGEPIVLQVRETFNAAVTKKYDIYVDDVLVDQRILAGAAQAKMYRVLVDDPQVLDHAGKVRVRFEFPATGTSGFYDPSVADLWVTSGRDWRPPAPAIELDRTSPGEPGWDRGPVTAAITATDDRDDAPALEVDRGAGWVTYGDPIVLDDEGEVTLRYRATDAAGNISPERSMTVRVDTVAPVTALSAVAVGHERRRLEVTATDATSGVASTRYRVDEGEWQLLGQSVPEISGAGEHLVQFASTDVAGNVEEVRSQTVSIAAEYAQGPVTAEVSQDGGAGWHSAGAALTLSATGSPDTLEYRLDGGPWQVWTAAVPLPGGTVVVDYRASDRGAYSEVGSVTVQVDDVAPTVALTWAGRTLTLTDADEGGSGVRLVEYRLDAGAWTTYVEPVTLDGAAHTVAYRVVDHAGNVSAEGTSALDAVPTGPAAAPVATTAPVVTGAARIGQRWQATVGVWSVEGVSTTTQWLRDGAPIPGATASTYVLTRADLGARIGVLVTASRAGHATGTAQVVRPERVAKAVSRVRVTGARAVRAGAKARLVVRVVVSGLTAGGKVRVLDGRAQVVTGQLVRGRAVLRVRLERPGVRRLAVRYLGSDSVAASVARVSVRVR
jgi:alpha-L-rhamnosidase